MPEDMPEKRNLRRDRPAL